MLAVENKTLNPETKKIEPLVYECEDDLGDYCLIPLTQGKQGKVSPEDYAEINQYKWHVGIQKHTKYAKRWSEKINGKRRLCYMHRDILKLKGHIRGDHRNGDGLDNRRGNLRIATNAENTRNKRNTKENTTSVYKGVCKRKDTKNWLARITYNYKRIYLGTFEEESEAARAYDRGARLYHGQFACLNFPAENNEEFDMEFVMSEEEKKKAKKLIQKILDLKPQERTAEQLHKFLNELKTTELILLCRQYGVNIASLETKIKKHLGM